MTVHIVVFPGNPGMWAFYRKFIERLVLRFGKDLNIYFVNYISHGLDSNRLVTKYGYIEASSICGEFNWLIKHRSDYTIKIAHCDKWNNSLNDVLLDNLSYSTTIVSEIIESETFKDEDKLIFIGHDIGCYVALKLAEPFYEVVHKVILTSPIFEYISNTNKYTYLRFLVIFRFFISLIASLLMICAWLLSYVPIKIFMDSDTIDLYYMLKPSCISSGLELTKSMMNSMNGEYCRTIFKTDQINKKIQIVLSRDDKWNPKKYAKLLIHDGVINKDIVHVLKIDHVYMVDEMSYCKVVDKIYLLSTQMNNIN